MGGVNSPVNCNTFSPDPDDHDRRKGGDEY